MAPSIYRRAAADECVLWLSSQGASHDISMVVIRRSKEANDLTLKPPEPLPRPQETLKLTDQYIALLMLVFTSAGLMDVSLDRRYALLVVISDNNP